jgi:hypothetical protein
MKYFISILIICFLSRLIYAQYPTSDIKLKITSKVRGSEILSDYSIISITTDGKINYITNSAGAASNFITGYNQTETELIVNFCPEDEDEDMAMFSPWIKGTLRANLKTNILQFYEPCFGCENYQQP